MLYKNSLIKKIFLFLLPLVFVAGGILRISGLSVEPQSVEAITHTFFIPCWFHWFTNLDCPGCGLTRSVVSFFLWSPYWSFYFHPLGPVLGFSLVVYWISLVNILVARCVQQILVFTQKHAMSVLIVVFAWGVFRNL